MKTFLIILAVVIVIVGGIWYYNATSVPQTVPTNTSPVTDNTPEDDQTNDEVESRETKIINISGTNYQFSFSEIQAEVGDRIRINLTSEQGLHDFVIDELNVATDQLSEGESGSVEFTVTEAGSYEYYCSVGQHRELGMVGTLVVE